MLETLTRGFRAARDRLTGATRLSEDNVAEALREVRLALLEADVDLGIVRDFLDRVAERCVGRSVRLRARDGGRTLEARPADHFVKACYDELVERMGAGEPISPAKRTRALLLVGLQGSGKTSTAAKLAVHLKREGERPLLVAADVRRPAAREQLRILGAQSGIEVFERDSADAPSICAESMEHARAEGLHSVILDTGGRLQIDDDLMQELEEVAARVRPERTLLVCDAMMGREAVNVARGFAGRIALDGLVLTKLDGDARGGAALAIRTATGVPICYVTTGESAERLEPFRAEGLASRILGMGDVVGLMRDFEQVTDAERAQEDAERLLRGRFTLEDFLAQLRTLQRMGPIRDLVDKLPFAGEILPEGHDLDGKELRRTEAMILSMTSSERARPETIDDSRRARIARGSGTREEELSSLLTRFAAMRDMVAQLGKGGGLLGKIPGLGRMLGGDGAELAGLDPAALGLGGAAPNRRVARAAKAEARRQQRKSKRKHVRRGRKR